MDKHPGGRPLLFNTPKELDYKINEYFKEFSGYQIIKDEEGNICIESKTGKPIVELKPPTITGLAFFLGFESRQSMYDYEKRPEFSYCIKKGRLQCEMFAERMLYTGTPTGAIFALKNFGWKDRIDHLNINKNIEDMTEEEIDKELEKLNESDRN